MSLKLEITDHYGMNINLAGVEDEGCWVNTTDILTTLSTLINKLDGFKTVTLTMVKMDQGGTQVDPNQL